MDTAKNPSISVIIVSYSTKKDTLACLQSLSASAPGFNLETIVIDNHSTDDSVPAITKKFPHVKLLKNQKNRGFSQANNQGAQKARGEYLFFLNSDTILPPNSLSSLYRQVVADHIDIASSKLLNLDSSLQPQGGAQPSVLNIALWMLNLDQLPLIRRLIPPYHQTSPDFFQSPQSPGWLAGTALLVKRSVFETLGGFDPQIFMYAEDVDFCYRATLLGFKLKYYPHPHIIHRGQASSHSQNAILGEYQGLLYFFQKHGSQTSLKKVKFWLKAGALLRMIVFGMMRSYAKKSIYQQAARLV